MRASNSSERSPAKTKWVWESTEAGNDRANPARQSTRQRPAPARWAQPRELGPRQSPSRRRGGRPRSRRRGSDRSSSAQPMFLMSRVVITPRASECARLALRRCSRHLVAGVDVANDPHTGIVSEDLSQLCPPRVPSRQRRTPDRHGSSEPIPTRPRGESTPRRPRRPVLPGR